MSECKCERKKLRSDKEQRLLINRVRRILGQVGAIEKMITEDAYCPDVLIQISAAESALRSLSRVMLREHINTCVLNDIRDGKCEAAEELSELISKLGG